MPPLVIFTVARQIIIDKDSGAISAVAIFSGLTAPMQRADAENAEGIPAIPFEWGCVAIFRRLQEDVGREFEAQFRFIGPDERMLFESPPSRFIVADLTHSIPLKVNGFPVPREGTYIVAAFLREYDIDAKWQEVGRHLIDVSYVPAEESQAMNEQ
jgi:hypothetical protein